MFKAHYVWIDSLNKQESGYGVFITVRVVSVYSASDSCISSDASSCLVLKTQALVTLNQQPIVLKGVLSRPACLSDADLVSSHTRLCVNVQIGHIP